MNFFKENEIVLVGSKQGKIVRVLKDNKYRVALNFKLGIRNWDFKESDLRKV